MFGIGNKFISSKYTGVIIDDLSKNVTCDFFGTSYTICIQHGESNITECYKDPCGNGQVVTSLCFEDEYHGDGKISLELVNGTENRTIISFFCVKKSCSQGYSEVMLHNIEICKCMNTMNCLPKYVFFTVVCDENADYENEGNGIKPQGGVLLFFCL